MEIDKNNKRHLIIVLIILIFFSAKLYSQTENYKLIVQFDNSSFVFKLYENPNTWSKTIGNIPNNDTVFISTKQGDWFNVKTSTSTEGWFLINNGVVWDADKNDWSESRITFLDAPDKSPINLNNLFFKNIMLEKLNSLESKLSELESRVVELETQTKTQSIRTKISSQQQPAAQVGPEPPSGDQIKQAITDFFAKKVPPTWAGSLMGGKNAQIQSIEIYQTGNYNDRVRYWPVRARVVGTCQANLLSRYETTSFDNVGDFKVYQDDYGNWKATMDSF